MGNLTKLFAIRRSIQAKIFVSFNLLTFLAMFAMTWIWYDNSTAMLKRNATRYVMDNIKDANHSLDLMMSDFMSLITLVSMNKENVVKAMMPKSGLTDYERFLNRLKVESFLQSIYSFNSSILAIDVLDSKGQLYSAGDPKLYYRELEDIWMEEVKEAAGKIRSFRVSLQDGLDPESDESHLIAIGQAIMKNGRPVGAVFLYIRYTAISHLFDSQPLEGTQVMLIGQDGSPIYHSDPDLLRMEFADDPDLTQNLRRIQHEGGEMDFQRNGCPVLIYRSDQTMWTTVGIIPVESLIHDSRELRDKTFWLVGVVLAAALFVSIALSRHMTRNIERLSVAMKEVEDGNLKLPALPRSRDEIGQLSDRFAAMMRTIQSLIRDIKEKEKKKREVDLKALQTQIHPHFLYNTLNTIRYLAKLQHVPNIEEVTGSLIELLRSVSGRGQDYVTMVEELANIANYVNIQRYRFAEDFEVHYDVDDDLLRCRIIPLLLQPLVENSLLHGLVGHEAERIGTIVIRIAKCPDGRSFLVQVTDNGPGMPPGRLQAIQENASDDRQMFGIGLSNVHERIRLSYGEPYGLRLESEPGIYTRAELHLPILYEKRSA
ncbi:cache domain-containing sensor histidine kinase [Paenibacillus spongiae]|uniref:Histidine kinase n=1 Tax=Paenibacillus spongiae TaxID=2909671 RepID=A0ABY5S5G0_9BACL|nr:sensor histidine kinase [Paenibacillus spongiae]UVI29147.1 histidine kinase [Paenibacillus spongiae]